jgi:hypothetical protein
MSTIGFQFQPDEEPTTEPVDSDYEGEIDEQKEARIAQKWSEMMGAQVKDTLRKY